MNDRVAARLKEMRARCEAATDEKWIVIPHARHYQVSNFGRVRSLLKPGNHKDKIGSNYRVLKQFKDARGYCSVQLKNDYTNKYEKNAVHRLVAHAFCEGKRSLGYHVAHLDGNPTNNKSTNLLICTAKVNNSHKKVHGTDGTGSKNSQAKLQEWQIEEILFLSSKSIPQGRIANLFDVSHKTVSEIVARKSWKHVSSRTDLPALIDALEVALENLSDIMGNGESEWCSVIASQALKQIEARLGVE